MIPKSTHHKLRKSYTTYSQNKSRTTLFPLNISDKMNEQLQKKEKILRLKLGHKNSYLFYLFYLLLCNEQLNHTITLKKHTHTYNRWNKQTHSIKWRKVTGNIHFMKVPMIKAVPPADCPRNNRSKTSPWEQQIKHGTKDAYCF